MLRPSPPPLRMIGVLTLGRAIQQSPGGPSSKADNGSSRGCVGKRPSMRKGCPWPSPLLLPACSAAGMSLLALVAALDGPGLGPAKSRICKGVCCASSSSSPSVGLRKNGERPAVVAGVRSSTSPQLNASRGSPGWASLRKSKPPLRALPAEEAPGVSIVSPMPAGRCCCSGLERPLLAQRVSKTLGEAPTPLHGPPIPAPCIVVAPTAAAALAAAAAAVAIAQVLPASPLQGL